MAKMQPNLLHLKMNLDIKIDWEKYWIIYNEDDYVFS